MLNKIPVPAFALLIVATVLVRADVAEANLLEDGLVSYWTFNTVEDGILRDVRGTNHGTVNGDPKLVQGKFGLALEFDGDGDYINCGNDPTLNFDRKDAFSVGAWVNIDRDFDAHTVVVAKMLSYGTYRGWSIRYRGWTLDQSAKVGYMEVILKHHHMLQDAFDAATVGPLPDADWLHLVMTYDGSSKAAGVNLYVDGESVPMELFGNIDSLTDTIINETSLNIAARGTDKGQVPRFFKGVIDEVFIYNRELTADQVKRNFDAEGYAVDFDDGAAVTWAAIKASE